MIRSYAQSLKSHPLESLAIITLWVMMLAMPGALAQGALIAQDSVTAWLDHYQPVVYIADDVEPQAIKALSEELAAWPGVASVEHRSPAQAVELLSERLGPEEVQRLGISAAMMPSSLIIKPRYAAIDHVSLISRVAALEARERVSAVDTPSAAATGQLKLISSVGLIVALMLSILCATSLVLMVTYLRHLSSQEQHELAALELFGVSSFDLARGSLARGVTLGAWAGLIAAASLLALQFSLQAQVPVALRQSGGLSWGWAIAMLPLLLSPSMGLIAALWAAGRRMPQRTSRSEDLRPLLRYSAELTPQA